MVGGLQEMRLRQALGEQAAAQIHVRGERQQALGGGEGQRRATEHLLYAERRDLGDVGTVQGELDALNRLMDLSILNLPLQWRADRTFLVPGHGQVYDKFDLLEYRDAVTIVRDRVQALIDEGKTLAQVKAANPTLGYRSEYGADSGPWTTEMFVEVIYNELAAKKGKKP